MTKPSYLMNKAFVDKLDNAENLQDEIKERLEQIYKKCGLSICRRDIYIRSNATTLDELISGDVYGNFITIKCPWWGNDIIIEIEKEFNAKLYYSFVPSGGYENAPMDVRISFMKKGVK